MGPRMQSAIQPRTPKEAPETAKMLAIRAYQPMRGHIDYTAAHPIVSLAVGHLDEAPQ
jgi:hypothetical protein